MQRDPKVKVLHRLWFAFASIVFAALTGGLHLCVAAGAGASAQTMRDMSKLFPEGEGRSDVLVSCATCHGLANIVIQHKDQGTWETKIQSMVQGSLSEDQIKIISGYLARNFGADNPLFEMPIDVNKASAAQLMRLPGLDARDVAAIIEQRDKLGKFSSVEEVKLVIGIAKWNDAENFLAAE